MNQIQSWAMVFVLIAGAGSAGIILEHLTQTLSKRVTKTQEGGEVVSDGASR